MAIQNIKSLIEIAEVITQTVGGMIGIAAVREAGNHKVKENINGKRGNYYVILNLGGII